MQSKSAMCADGSAKSPRDRNRRKSQRQLVGRGASTQCLPPQLAAHPAIDDRDFGPSALGRRKQQRRLAAALGHEHRPLARHARSCERPSCHGMRGRIVGQCVSSGRASKCHAALPAAWHGGGGRCQNQQLPVALPCLALPCSQAKPRLTCVRHTWRRSQAHTGAYGRWGQRTCQRLDELEALSQEVYNRVHARVGQ